MGMLHDRDEDYRAGGPGIELELHERLVSDKILTHPGAMSSTVRFGDFIERSEMEDKHYHVRTYGAGSACMELGVLKENQHKELSKSIRTARNKMKRFDHSGKRVSMKESEAKELRMIRTASVNALHMSFLMYADDFNQSLQKVYRMVGQAHLLLGEIAERA